MEPAALAVAVSVEPPDPAEGDVVVLDASITNTTGGLAGIPLFRLRGAEPWFVVESQENSYPEVTFARYRLRAVGSGVAVVWLSVNFATSTGCVEAPRFFFSAADSHRLSVTVRGEAGGGTPPPTATPLPPAAATRTPTCRPR